MDLRLTFNEVPSDYDKWRPTYVPELYEDILAYINITPESRLLEVGIGTGQATLPFLKMGCHVTAVELGGDLAAFTKNKFSAYENLEIFNTAFEDFACSDNSFDLAYSASAFHWIPEEMGYSKIFRLLKSGGVFARFANHPYRENSPMHRAIQGVYEKYFPVPNFPPQRYNAEMAEQNASIGIKYGFSDIQSRVYHRMRMFNAEDYAVLMGTMSDHRALGTERLAALQSDIETAINSFGGMIEIQDTLDLQLMRKVK